METDRRTLLGGAALAAAGAIGIGGAKAAGGGANVNGDLTAAEIEKLLDLKPNATCGYVRVTWVSGVEAPEGALPPPFAAKRPVGSGLFFMVTPDEPVKLHRIRNDQFYHYYLGDPLEVLLLRNGGERIVMGPDIRAGQHVQFLIPGNTFHTARIIGSRQWFLGGSTEWPGVIPADVELGDAAKLAAEFPAVADDIRAFPQPI